MTRTLVRPASSLCGILIVAALTAAIGTPAVGHEGRRYDVQVFEGQLVAQGYNSGGNDGAPDVRPYANVIHDHWTNFPGPTVAAQADLPGYDVMTPGPLVGENLILELTGSSKWESPPITGPMGAIPDGTIPVFTPLGVGETIFIDYDGDSINTNMLGSFVLDASVASSGESDLDLLYTIGTEPANVLMVLEWTLSTSAPGVADSDTVYSILSPDGTNAIEKLHLASLFLEDFLGQNLYLHTWDSAVASESWATDTNWLKPGTPTSHWQTLVENTQAFDQAAVVAADSTVELVTVKGITHSMEVHIQSGATLTALDSVVVDANGVARVDGTLAAAALDVKDGGTIQAELATPGTSHITVDGDASIAARATLSLESAALPPAGAHLFPIIEADADSAGGGLVSGTFDTVNLPGDDGLGRRYSVLYENRAADGVGVVDTVKIGLARPGDANFDGQVEGTDLLAASPFFGTTTPTDWRDGNWNDTGISKDIVDALDLLDASPFFAQSYGSGTLPLGGDATTPGQSSDGTPSIIYDFATGEILIDTDGNPTNSYVLDSLAGIFTAASPVFVGGTIFTTDNDFRIAENFHSNLTGVHNLGAVAQPFLNQAFLLTDLTLQGGQAGQPNFEFDLVLRNTPEPSTLVLLALGLLGLAGVVRRQL